MDTSICLRVRAAIEQAYVVIRELVTISLHYMLSSKETAMLPAPSLQKSALVQTQKYVNRVEYNYGADQTLYYVMNLEIGVGKKSGHDLHAKFENKMM